jgi:hypothetical protein
VRLLGSFDKRDDHIAVLILRHHHGLDCRRFEQRFAELLEAGFKRRLAKHSIDPFIPFAGAILSSSVWPQSDLECTSNAAFSIGVASLLPGIHFHARRGMRVTSATRMQFHQNAQ